MTTQSVEISEEQAKFIREIVAAGRYQDENAVVRAALLLLKCNEEEYRENYEDLRAEVQKGLDDIEGGRYIDLNSRDEISAYFDSVRAQRPQYLAREDQGS